MDEAARMIRLCEERGEFATLEDGCVYYFPWAATGCLSAHNLRAIADELDRRNAAWDGVVRRELQKGG